MYNKRVYNSRLQAKIHDVNMNIWDKKKICKKKTKAFTEQQNN